MINHLSRKPERDEPESEGPCVTNISIIHGKSSEDLHSHSNRWMMEGDPRSHAASNVSQSSKASEPASDGEHFEVTNSTTNSHFRTPEESLQAILQLLQHQESWKLHEHTLEILVLSVRRLGIDIRNLKHVNTKAWSTASTLRSRNTRMTGMVIFARTLTQLVKST